MVYFIERICKFQNTVLWEKKRKNRKFHETLDKFMEFVTESKAI